MKYIKKGNVSASMCDPSVKLSAIGALEVIEDMITEMTGKLKIDGETCMREYGAMWVFTRNRTEFRAPIRWPNEYVAECYITAKSGVMSVDTLIKSQDVVAVASRIDICALDLKTGALRRLDTVGVTDAIVAEEPETQILFTRKKYETKELIESVVSRSMDIDYCHHTNNVAYVRYILNTYSNEYLLKTPIKAIEIKYCGQTYEGDTLNIYSAGGGEFVITCKDKPVVNCTLTFNK